MSVMSTLARWTSARDPLVAELAKRTKARNALVMPSGTDIEAYRKWRTDLVRLDGEVQDAQSALDVANAETVKAQAAKDAADKTAAAEMLLRKARANADAEARLTREIEVDAINLAEKLRRLEASVHETNEYNRARGDLPAVEDGERRLRVKMDGGRAAITSRMKGYVDRDGNRCSNQFAGPDGLNRYRDDVEIVEFDEVIVPALPSVPIMPERFANAFKLVGIAGNQIWPPC